MPTRTVAVPPVAVTVAPPVLDIGEELELEARRRSIAEARGERVAIFANNQQNIARLRKRMRWMAVPVALYGVLALLEPATFVAVWLFLIAECVVIYQLSKRVYSRQTLPVVTLTNAGIEVHTMGHDIGLIHWSEISDIRAYNLMYRYVGITLHDTASVCSRLSARQQMLIKMNAACIPLYRVFRKFVAPINLAQQNLPLSADALVAQINQFRATHRV